MWVCTHQEAGRIIQEAAKAAHKTPFQKEGVFWGQLIWVVGDSRRTETLPPCRREGLGKKQARMPSKGWRSQERAGGPQDRGLCQFAEHINRNSGKATMFG